VTPQSSSSQGVCQKASAKDALEHQPRLCWKARAQWNMKFAFVKDFKSHASNGMLNAYAFANILFVRATAWKNNSRKIVRANSCAAGSRDVPAADGLIEFPAVVEHVVHVLSGRMPLDARRGKTRTAQEGTVTAEVFHAEMSSLKSVSPSNNEEKSVHAPVSQPLMCP